MSKVKIPKPWKKLTGKPNMQNEDDEYMYVLENKNFCFEVTLCSIKKQKYVLVYFGHRCDLYVDDLRSLKYKTHQEGMLKLNVIIKKEISKIMREIYKRHNQEIEFLMKVNSKFPQK